MSIIRIAALIVGLILTFKPELYFKLKKPVLYDKHEHKDTIIKVNRITGVVILIIMGITLLI